MADRIGAAKLSCIPGSNRNNKSFEYYSYYSSARSSIMSELVKPPPDCRGLKVFLLAGAVAQRPFSKARWSDGRGAKIRERAHGILRKGRKDL